MDPKKLISTIKGKCQEAPERIPGYQEALLESVADIVWLEREHAIQAISIQKKVTDCCEALGEFIYQKSESDV